MKVEIYGDDLLIRPETEEEKRFLKKKFVYGDRYITWNFTIPSMLLPEPEFAGLQIFGDNREQKILVCEPLESQPACEGSPPYT